MQAASRCLVYCGSCNWFGDYDIRLDLIFISEHIHMTVVLEHSGHRVTCENGFSFAQWWCSLPLRNTEDGDLFGPKRKTGSGIERGLALSEQHAQLQVAKTGRTSPLHRHRL